LIERTLSIIKPDATKRDITGKINAMIEAIGLRIVAQKRVWLTDMQAKGFYSEHAGKPFFAGFIHFMISGPVVLQVLEGDNAITRYREIMGATNPKDADAGTIRHSFAETIEANTVHGSDSATSAKREISYFFSDIDIVG
jgi:nucleoside-diphosphate kinase